MQILAYLFYFIAASVSPLQRRWLAVKREGGGQIAFSFQTMLIVALLGTIVLPFIHPFALQGDRNLLFTLVLVCGLTGGLHFVSNYSAQKHVDAGLSTIIVNIYTPVTIIIASLFLHEGLKYTQIIGTVLLLVAMVLVSKKHRIGHFCFDRYFWLMFLSGLALGIDLSSERALMKTTGFTVGVLLSWWAQTLSLGAATLLFKNRTTYSLKNSLVTGGLKFFQSLSWVLLLLIVNNLSVVSAVTTFKVVIIFVAAALWLNEREDLPRKIIGSLIAVAGLLLMK